MSIKAPTLSNCSKYKHFLAMSDKPAFLISISTVHSQYHRWVTEKLSCKSRTKNGRNVVEVLLERYE